MSGEQRQGVPAHAERGVDQHDIAGSGGGGGFDRGREQFVDPPDQDWHMTGELAVVGLLPAHRHLIPC